MEHKQQPEFKWFGEGFDGFSRRLPEDVVEYQVFLLEPSLKAPDSRRKQLSAAIKAGEGLVEEILKDYIWQKESFQLELKTEEGRDFLSGRTAYGDSVEDEWLVVYLLQELSRRVPNSWIKVQDSDGEFLLVEAANTLPKWMSPEIAENRVWIHNGELHLIPLHQSRQEKSKEAASKPLVLDEALKFIQDSPSLLLQSPTIEAEAFYRLRNYPQQIQANMHNAEITIPRKLLYILRRIPSSISQAVEAFYLRDPIALNALRPKGSSPLVFAPVDLVSAVVRLTKVGYAQVKSQQFSPPATWAAALAYPDAEGHAKVEAGMKLACGFEMFIGDPQNQNDERVKAIRQYLGVLESGQEKLPTDEEIASSNLKADNDAWMNINYEEFEKELAGKASKGKPGFPMQGFGSQTTQEDVKKIVERFESFLNDDKAGFEGAEMSDEMSSDDETDELDEETDEGEDKAASFDNDEFESAMREMMGLPPETAAQSSTKPTVKSKTAELESDAESEDLDNAALKSIMSRIEKELNEPGGLGGPPVDVKGKGKVGADVKPDVDTSAELDDDDLEWIQAALLKNMGENFKPGGNEDGPELSSDEEVV